MDEDWTSGFSVMVVVVYNVARVVEEAVDEGLEASMSGIFNGEPSFSYSS